MTALHSPAASKAWIATSRCRPDKTFAGRRTPSSCSFRKRSPNECLVTIRSAPWRSPQGEVPEAARKLVPKYPLVSCTLLGRLAIAKAEQGQGLGSILFADALLRAFESASTVGSSMVVVDALNEDAVNFYAAHGFVRLPDSLRLVTPMRQAGANAADRPF